MFIRSILFYKPKNWIISNIMFKNLYLKINYFVLYVKKYKSYLYKKYIKPLHV